MASTQFTADPTGFRSDTSFFSSMRLRLLTVAVATLAVLAIALTAHAALVTYKNGTATINTWYSGPTATIKGGDMSVDCAWCFVYLQTYVYAPPNYYHVARSYESQGSIHDVVHPAYNNYKSRCRWYWPNDQPGATQTLTCKYRN